MPALHEVLRFFQGPDKIISATPMRCTNKPRKQVQILNLVPIGAYNDWNEYGEDCISSILLACYDIDAGSLVATCTMPMDGSLRKDTNDDNTLTKHYCEFKECLEELYDYIRPLPQDIYELPDDLEACDVWFDPVMVWKVRVQMQIESTKVQTKQDGHNHDNHYPLLWLSAQDKFSNFQYHHDTDKNSLHENLGFTKVEFLSILEGCDIEDHCCTSDELYDIFLRH